MVGVCGPRPVQSRRTQHVGVPGTPAGTFHPRLLLCSLFLFFLTFLSTVSSTIVASLRILQCLIRSTTETETAKSLLRLLPLSLGIFPCLGYTCTKNHPQGGRSVAGELGGQGQPWLHKQVHGQSGPLGSRLANKTKTKNKEAKTKII